MVVKKLLLALIAALLLSCGLQAQSIKLSSSVRQSVVSLNEQVQLSLEISSDKYLRLSAPTAPQVSGLVYRTMLSSTSTESSWVNGRRSSLYRFVYTYSYSPQKEGKFSLPGFRVRISGKEYSTQPIAVEVVDASFSSPGQSNPDPGYDPYIGNFFSRGRTTGQSILVCLPASQSVWLGEPAIVSYYLYSNQMVESFYAEAEKDYEGYGKAVFEQPSSLDYEDVTYNGERYQRALIKKTALYPQVAGRLQAPTLTGNIQFTGVYSFLNRALRSTGAWIEVKPLPAGKPAGYTGAVGVFEVSHSLSSHKLNLGEALTCTVRITGRGNFSQFTAPPYPEVEKLRVSDPAVQDKLGSLLEGTRYIHYTLLPQATGDLRLPGVSFSWFDTASGTYKRFTAPAQTIAVKPAGALSYLSGLLQGEQPRSLQPLLLRTDYPAFRDYVSQAWFWLILAACALSLLVSGFLAYERRLSRLDPQAYAQKTASRILQKYLRQATAAAADSSSAFYPLAESGLRDYLAKKYSLSKSLSTPELLAALAGKGLDAELVKQVEIYLLTCQKARFMPGGADSESLDRALARLRSVVQGFSSRKNPRQAAHPSAGATPDSQPESSLKGGGEQ